MTRPTVMLAAVALVATAACSSSPINLDTTPSVPLTGIEQPPTGQAGDVVTTEAPAANSAAEGVTEPTYEPTEDVASTMSGSGGETPSPPAEEDNASAELQDILDSLDDLEDILGDLDDGLDDLGDAFDEDEGDVEE